MKIKHITEANYSGRGGPSGTFVVFQKTFEDGESDSQVVGPFATDQDAESFVDHLEARVKQMNIVLPDDLATGDNPVELFSYGWGLWDAYDITDNLAMTPADAVQYVDQHFAEVKEEYSKNDE